MTKRSTYRYHRFLGIMIITVVGTGLLKIDFSKINNKDRHESLNNNTVATVPSSVGNYKINLK